MGHFVGYHSIIGTHQVNNEFLKEFWKKTRLFSKPTPGPAFFPKLGLAMFVGTLGAGTYLKKNANFEEYMVPRQNFLPLNQNPNEIDFESHHGSIQWDCLICSTSKLFKESKRKFKF